MASETAACLRQRLSDAAGWWRLSAAPVAVRLSTRSGRSTHPAGCVHPSQLNLSKILIPVVRRRQLLLLNMSPPETWTTGFLNPILLQTRIPGGHQRNDIDMKKPPAGYIKNGRILNHAFATTGIVAVIAVANERIQDFRLVLGGINCRFVLLRSFFPFTSLPISSLLLHSFSFSPSLPSHLSPSLYLKNTVKMFLFPKVKCLQYTGEVGKCTSY